MLSRALCVCNGEPIADFIDLFLPGEGEEVTNELIDLVKEFKQNGGSKAEFLRAAAQIEGVYVPSLYDVEYNPDGTISRVTANGGAPQKVRKRIISDLDKVYYPEKFVVPFLDIVHDRAVEEIFAAVRAAAVSVRRAFYTVRFVKNRLTLPLTKAAPCVIQPAMTSCRSIH